uniref:Uncharacterized protein n=1 Tax=Anguilla anguilla TaxID=7936 RepID=A0A0E9WJN3_ANGAN
MAEAGRMNSVQKYLLRSNQMPQNSLDSSSPCSRTMTPNVLPKQPRSFSGIKSERS